MSWTRHTYCAGVVGIGVLAGSAAAAQGLADARGLIVEQVAADSLGARAGIAPGDRLLAYDDRSLLSPATLQALQENTFGKDELVLRVRRGEEMRTLTVSRGSLGIEARPELPIAVLSAYEEGRSALQAQKTDMAVAAWTSAARAAQDAGDSNAAAWLQWRIGAVHEGQRRWKDSEAAYTASWELLARGDDHAFQSQALLALGRVTRNQNELQAAAQRFSQARDVDAAAGNEMWVARDLTTLGSLSYARGDLTGAEDSESRSLAIKARLVPNSADVAASLNGLGAITYARGDVAAAHDYFSRALELRERLVPDSLDVAASLNNLGLVANARGDPSAALAYHTRALGIRTRLAPDSPLVAGSLNNLGLIAENRGDLGEAETYYSRALEMHERQASGSLDAASDLNNLGNVAASRGDLDAAQSYYRRALEIKERLAPNTMTVASTLKNLGDITRSAGNPATAAEYDRRALAIEERLAPASLAIATTLNNLGKVATEQGDFGVAEQEYSRALGITERLSPNSLTAATSLNDLAVVARRRGNLAQAQDYGARALAIRDRLAPNSLPVAESLTAMGDVAFTAGRVSESRALFSRAVTIVEAQRSTIVSTDARALLVAQNTGPYGGLLRSLVALGDIPAAFATLERARARSLADFLAERQLDLRADAPSELLNEQNALDGRRSAAYAALISNLTEVADTRINLGHLATNAEQGRIQTLEQSIQNLEQRLEGLRGDLQAYAVQQRTLDVKIRQASPRLAALRYPAPLDLAGAQDALDAGTLLLAYFVDEAQTYLFAVTRTDVQVFTLPVGRVLLGQQVTRFREIVTRQRLGNLEEPGAQLYDTLIRPASDALNGAQRVLICPDGALQVLPFAALISQRAPTPRFFVEDRPFHTISSMTVYAETRRWATEQATRQVPGRKFDRTVLAVGDPVYAKGQLKSESAEAAYVRRRGLNLVPLPQTREEVEEISRLFGKSARVRLGRNATETIVRREAKDADILHFALHGWMDAASGLSSGLALSQPDVLGLAPTAEDDGLLQAWEIFEHVRLKADLVVLSACETGLGQDLQGEGLIGLTRAFLYAGARSVVVSLWDVSDTGASEFMKAFYQALRKGASKDVALQRAMVSMLRNPTRRHPFYWSPFVLVGDWQ